MSFFVQHVGLQATCDADNVYVMICDDAAADVQHRKSERHVLGTESQEKGIRGWSQKNQSW